MNIQKKNIIVYGFVLISLIVCQFMTQPVFAQENQFQYYSDLDGFEVTLPNGWGGGNYFHDYVFTSPDILYDGANLIKGVSIDLTVLPNPRMISPNDWLTNNRPGIKIEKVDEINSKSSIFSIKQDGFQVETLGILVGNDRTYMVKCDAADSSMCPQNILMVLEGIKITQTDNEFLETSELLTSAEGDEIKMPFIGLENHSWEIIQGYNTNLTHLGYQKYSFDLARMGDDADEETAKELALAPVSGEIAWGGYPLEPQGCISIKTDIPSLGGASIVRTMVCHIVFDRDFRTGRYVVQGQVLGKYAEADDLGNGGSAHAHITLYKLNSPTNESDREGLPFEGDGILDATGNDYSITEDNEFASDLTTNQWLDYGPLYSSNFIPPAVDVALIIDSSGSMLSSDPKNMRKEAAKVFVSTMQNYDEVTVVDFDTYAKVFWYLNLVNNNRELINNAIDKVDSSGGTNIGAGLMTAYDQLFYSSPMIRKAAVLMTDGQGGYNNEAAYYELQGWPVYTIGLGANTNELLLKGIAEKTGGRYFKLDSANQLANVYFEIATEVAQGTIITDLINWIFSGFLWETPQLIPEAIKTIYFFINWGSDEPTVSLVSPEGDLISQNTLDPEVLALESGDVSLSLITPSGILIDQNTVDPNVFHAKGLTYELYRIDNPEAGEWLINALGVNLPPEGENVSLKVSVVGDSVSNLPPTLAVPDELIVQYSDNVLFDVSASDVDDDISSLVFSVDGLPDDLVFFDNGDGTATISGVINVAPGLYPVTVTVSDPEGLTDTGVTQINVTQEDARATYTGPMLVSTPCTDCSTAVVPLRATIQDITNVLGDTSFDDYPGNITLAMASFIDRDSNAVLCSAPVTLFDSADSSIGSAACDWTADIGTQDGYDYNIGIDVDGYYTRNSTADDAIVVVSKPSENSVTGGGYLLNSSTAGTYAGDEGLRTHFGFNIKFIGNKGRGQNIVGRATILIRQDGHIYRIKTNALESLVVVPAKDENPAVGEFLSKVSIEDVTVPNQPVLLDTKALLNLTMTDYDEASGQYRDLIGISIWSKNGSLLFSSNWTGTQTVEQIIESGNLEIHEFSQLPK